MKQRKALKKRVKAGTSKVALAARKRKFKAEYLKNGGNGYQAAIVAGYKPGASAERAAVRLSGDVRVRAAIAKDAETIAERAGLSVERTLREVRRLAYSDPRRFYDKDGNLIAVHDLDDDTAATIASIEHEEIWSGRGGDREQTGLLKKLKVWDKNSALEKAMKYHGLYKEDNKQQGEAASLALRVVFGK